MFLNCFLVCSLSALFQDMSDNSVLFSVTHFKGSILDHLIHPWVSKVMDMLISGDNGNTNEMIKKEQYKEQKINNG